MKATENLAAAWAAVLCTETPTSALERAWAAALAGPAGDGEPAAARIRSLPVPVPMPAMPVAPAVPPASWSASFERGSDGLVESVLVNSEDPTRPAWLLTPVRDAQGRLLGAEIKPLGGESEQ